MMGPQGHDLTPQVTVIATGVAHEGVALRRFLPQCFMKDLLNSIPLVQILTSSSAALAS
jgi:hypothetical protein